MDEAQIAQIVMQVMALMNSRPPALNCKKVLVIFSGASSGQVEGVEVIKRLAAQGHRVSAVLSAGGSYLVGAEKLREAGAHQVIGHDTWVNSPGMVRETDLVLIPTLSMNFASHLAMGFMDSLPATLVIGALLAGKPVIAIRDGADPDGSGGKVFKATGAAAALRTRLQGNLKALVSYGMELVSQDEFVAAVEHWIGEGEYRPSAGLAAPRPAPAMLTQYDVANLEPGSVLRIAPGTRMTPLASETLARLQIRIESD